MEPTVILSPDKQPRSVFSLSIVWICALAGSLLASWFAPGAIAWYFDPPVQFGVDCMPATEWAMTRLLYSQISGTGAGAALGLFLFFYFRKKKAVQ